MIKQIDGAEYCVNHNRVSGLRGLRASPCIQNGKWVLSSGQNDKGLTTRISFLLIVRKAQAAGSTYRPCQKPKALESLCWNRLAMEYTFQTLSFMGSILVTLVTLSLLSQARVTGGFLGPPGTCGGSGESEFVSSYLPS